MPSVKKHSELSTKYFLCKADGCGFTPKKLIHTINENPTLVKEFDGANLHLTETNLFIDNIDKCQTYKKGDVLKNMGKEIYMYNAGIYTYTFCISKMRHRPVCWL